MKKLFVAPATKYILIGLGTVVIVAAILFSLPIWSMKFAVTENFTETETRQEPYTDSVSTLIDKTQIVSKNILSVADWIYASGSKNFSVDIPNNNLVGSLVFLPMDASGDAFNGYNINIYDSNNKSIFSASGCTVKIDIPIKPGFYSLNMTHATKYVIQNYYQIKLELQHTEVVGKATEFKTTTKTREVPVQVEKQRTVIKEEKGSLWQLLFRK